MDEGHPESKISRSPWEKSEHRELNQASVTMWVGVASVIVAIPIKDVDPDALDISVVGTRLIIRGSARSNFLNRVIELPCVVDIHPIRIKDRKETLYILLIKRQEVDTKSNGYLTGWTEHASG